LLWQRKNSVRPASLEAAEVRRYRKADADFSVYELAAFFEGRP
jgi:hypothetical protein